MLYKTDSNL
jgi:hypothetical protein